MDGRGDLPSMLDVHENLQVYVQRKDRRQSQFG
jgi:hypothetical protein